VKPYHLTLTAVLICWMTLATGVASAQNPYWRSGYTLPRNQPVVSPWLSLGNGPNTALNYFNQVIPQRAFGNQINQLQTSVLANQQALNGLQQQVTSPLGPTGHAVAFMSFRQYFNTLGGVGGGANTNVGTAGGRAVGTANLGISAGATLPRSSRIR
jgi:hypothetical protein